MYVVINLLKDFIINFIIWCIILVFFLDFLMESLGGGYEYGFSLDEIINCIVIMNLDIIILLLIVKKLVNVDDYNFVLKINIIMFVELNIESGCYFIVCVVYYFIYFYFLKNINYYDVLGCFVNDIIFG